MDIHTYFLYPWESESMKDNTGRNWGFLAVYRYTGITLKKSLWRKNVFDLKIFNIRISNRKSCEGKRRAAG